MMTMMMMMKMMIIFINSIRIGLIHLHWVGFFRVLFEKVRGE